MHDAFITIEFELSFFWITFVAVNKELIRGDIGPLFYYLEMDDKLVEKLIVESKLIIDEFPELFLVNLTVTGVSGKQLVLVFIDSELGLPIEMCSFCLLYTSPSPRD